MVDRIVGTNLYRVTRLIGYGDLIYQMQPPLGVVIDTTIASCIGIIIRTFLIRSIIRSVFCLNLNYSNACL
jgi:hypothetical protein